MLSSASDGRLAPGRGAAATAMTPYAMGGGGGGFSSTASSPWGASEPAWGGATAFSAPPDVGAVVDPEDEAVQDFIDILEEHRSNCERQGKYVEAEIARARLDELRLHEETRRKEAMRSRQLAERLGVEEAHMLEFQQFNLLWDKKMAEYEENAAKLILAMKERHAAELRDFQQRLIAKASIPRHSKEYLNLRKIQEVLARQKNYVEAAKIKEKADELMAYEEEKWLNQRQADMYQKEMRFKQKLKVELLALKKRIEQGKGEQKRQRQVMLERLLQRYQNVKRELEQQQRLERVRAEKILAGRKAGAGATGGASGP